MMIISRQPDSENKNFQNYLNSIFISFFSHSNKINLRFTDQFFLKILSIKEFFSSSTKKKLKNLILFSIPTTTSTITNTIFIMESDSMQPNAIDEMNEEIPYSFICLIFNLFESFLCLCVSNVKYSILLLLLLFNQA